MTISSYSDFTLTLDELKKPLIYWAASQENIPTDFFKRMSVLNAKRSFVPVYEFAGTYSGNWNASSGYDRKEEYHEWREKANGASELVKKTRTVTDWRPSSGSVNGHYSFRFCAGGYDCNGMATVAKKCVHGGSKTLDQMEDVFEIYEDPGSASVWLSHGSSALMEKAQARAANSVPGDRHKDLHVDYSYNETKVSGLYVPIWKIGIKYQGHNFEIYCGGNSSQDDIAIDGDLPENVGLKAIANAGYWLTGLSVLIMLVVFIGGAYDWISISDDEAAQFTLWSLLLSIVFLGSAGFWKRYIHRKHREEMTDILASMGEPELIKLFSNCN